MKKLPQRKSPRLKDYDYSQAGAYSVTICTHLGEQILGDVQDGEMVHTPLGTIAHEDIPRIPSYWHNVDVDYFVVMPNHVHVIIVITDMEQPTDTKKPTLGNIVGNYKAGVTRRIRRNKIHQYDTIWQRRFYEHVIRDETDLNRIRQYILDNPAKWSDDLYYE